MWPTKEAVLAVTVNISETMRNLQGRIQEHSNAGIDSEPARHLREDPSHSFSCHILCMGQSFQKQRIFEGLMIHSGNLLLTNKFIAT